MAHALAGPAGPEGPQREQVQLANAAIHRAQGVVLAVDREFAAAQSALWVLRIYP